MGNSRRKEIKRHIAEDDLDELIAATDDEHELRRLIFIKNCYYGDTLEEAAARVGRSDATGSRWANRWNEAGLEGLMPDFGGGRPPKLDENEQEEFLEKLKQRDSWTSQEIRQLLQDEFNISYHPAYLSEFLRSLGLHYAKPRPERPNRPENAEQRLDERVETSLESDQPQNKREDDDAGGWKIDDDVVTDGGTVVGFFRCSLAAADRQ